jgi:hypothetical protein
LKSTPNVPHAEWTAEIRTGDLDWDVLTTLLRHPPIDEWYSRYRFNSSCLYLESCKKYILRPIQHRKTTLLEVLKLIGFLWSEEFNLSDGPHLPGPDQIFKPPGYFSRQGPLPPNSSNRALYREIQSIKGSLKMKKRQYLVLLI